MDLRHKFETETGNGIYSGDGQLLPSGSFKDEYVEWLEKLVKNNVDLAIVSGSKAQEYAEFCVECDRKGMKLLEYDGWIKLN